MAGEDYLLCFDDYHHVDGESVLNDLIRRLVRASQTGSLAVIVTSRRPPTLVRPSQFASLRSLGDEDGGGLPGTDAGGEVQGLLQEVEEGLTRQERAVMDALAVLPEEGASRDAVEAVANVGNVRRMMLRLAERQLVLVQPRSRGSEYRLDEAVRAYLDGQMEGSRRRGMYRRAGEHYQSEEPDPLRAGLYYEQAGDHQRETVQDMLEDTQGVMGA
jgi:ATP/maltotriose-dependent transcriptional regulator MalT